MESRSSLHSQLSTIMGLMARSALSQISKLVDEDSTKLRQELSRLLSTNSTLAERVSSLECELTVVKKDLPSVCRSFRTVGVQTVCDANESDSPVIKEIVGKEGCIDLWKDNNPDLLDKVRDSSQLNEQSVSATVVSDQIPVVEIRENVENPVSGQEQITPFKEAKHDESAAAEPKLAENSAGDGTQTLSCGQEQVQSEPTTSAEEMSLELMCSSDTEDVFSAHIIPIEDDDDDDDDDVQFVQERQQEPKVDPIVGPSHGVGHAKLSNNNEITYLAKHSHSLNITKVESFNKKINEKYTCKICSTTFYHKGTLTHHMKLHRANSIYQPHFTHWGKFNKHIFGSPMRFQGGSKSCEYCGKTFANPSALRIHYVVHTGEKPYICYLCGKGFTQKGNLKCHLRIHTGERPYHCGQCGRTFTQKVNLNCHLMAHRKNREVEMDNSVLDNNLKAEPGGQGLV